MTGVCGCGTQQDRQDADIYQCPHHRHLTVDMVDCPVVRPSFDAPSSHATWQQPQQPQPQQQQQPRHQWGTTDKDETTMDVARRGPGDARGSTG